MATLRERPEARWALWAGITGLIAAGALQVRAIFDSPDALAPMGFVVVPLIAALTAAAAGIWGLALGHVVERLRGRASGPRILFAAALAVALALPAAVGYETWRTLQAVRVSS